MTGILVVFLIASRWSAGGEAVESPVPLFEEWDGPEVDQILSPRKLEIEESWAEIYKRRRYVRVNVFVLETLLERTRESRVLLNLFPDAEFIARLYSQTDERGHVWTGQLEGIKHSEVSIYQARRRSGPRAGTLETLLGFIRVWPPGAQSYDIRKVGDIPGLYSVAEIDLARSRQGQEACGSRIGPVPESSEDCFPAPIKQHSLVLGCVEAPDHYHRLISTTRPNFYTGKLRSSKGCPTVYFDLGQVEPRWVASSVGNVPGLEVDMVDGDPLLYKVDLLGPTQSVRATFRGANFAVAQPQDWPLGPILEIISSYRPGDCT